MMNKWDYGGAFERHPIQTGTAVFKDGSRLKTGNLFAPLPNFMLRADCLFVDPPWTQGNMTSFYTKAGLLRPQEDYTAFYLRLFECVEEISPKVCYLEIGKDYLADFILKMRNLYHNVTFYNSSYYHNAKNHCYIVRGSDHAGKPKLDDMDEEDIIKWVCENEKYTCIGDLCMGRGLVARYAFAAERQFCGIELNHKRLSVALEELNELGGRYCIEP